MIIMNKLYKCALGLLTTFILSFTCFSSAVNLPSNNWEGNTENANGMSYTYAPDQISFTYNVVTTVDIIDSDNLFTCFRGTEGGSYAYSADSNFSNSISFGNNYLLCTDKKTFYIKHIQNNGAKVAFYYYREGDFYMNLNQYTSLQCQTEYNLIPIEEVTANYCRLNFDLIDPQECPINSGTGAIVRSNLMINDIPYAQNQNINVFIPDFLAWNVSFNDFNTTIEVEGYNANEEYIENIINQEKLTPTNKDIEEMLTGFMTNYFPYLALAIVFLYLARKIFKLFK